MRDRGRSTKSNSTVPDGSRNVGTGMEHRYRKSAFNGTKVAVEGGS